MDLKPALAVSAPVSTATTPEDASAIELHTQVETGEGRPDLEIRSPHRLAWVEVKAESELLSSFFKQTTPYRDDLAPDSISGNYGNPVRFHQLRLIACFRL